MKKKLIKKRVETKILKIMLLFEKRIIDEKNICRQYPSSNDNLSQMRI